MYSYFLIGADVVGLDTALPGGHLVAHLALAHQQTTASAHSLIGAWALVGVGLLMAVVGELGRRSRLPRNGFVGIRLSSTMRNDLTWQRAHRAAGGLISLSGLPLVAAGAIGLVTSTSAFRILAFGAAAVMLVILGVATWRAASAARES
jgi:uncharacterized membrane protein